MNQPPPSFNNNANGLTIVARELIEGKFNVMALPSQLTVLFEDGIAFQTTRNKIIYSLYFWEIHRVYQKTPLLSTHFVESILKGKLLTSNTHIDLLSVIAKDVTQAHQLRTPKEREFLLEMIYNVTNNIYNEISQMAEEYVQSIDILDFIEIVNHPMVLEAVNATEPTQESIFKTYRIVTDILQNDPTLESNAVAIAVRSRMVNINQVLQCVAVRGFLTEVDGAVLKIPVMSNFTRGLQTLYEFAAESRSAAKSLYFSDAKLQDAEYFARRLQQLAMVVERIDYSDCQSSTYLSWRVSPPIKDEKGSQIYPGDLDFMLGKYYLDEDTGTLKEITHNDPTLHDKVLKFRSVLFCRHPDPHAVCEVCFGGLSRNVSRFANLGHLCTATMTQQTTQSVLSVKHIDFSSSGSTIVLDETARQYFTITPDKKSYLLKPEMLDKGVKLVVSRDEVPGLIDILSIDDVKNISPLRVSQLECLDIVYTDRGEEFTMPVFVSQGNQKVILTSEFLDYLKTHRWETDGRNNFVFDPSKWDCKLPIFTLPEMEYSFSDHAALIAKVIESNMKNITERAKPHSAIATLQELFRLVNTKINVNISALEVIVYATMLPSPDEYALARKATDPVLGIASLIIKNRSLGTAYTYEDIYRTLIEPRNFFPLDRPDSVFDVFIAPQEVVDHQRNKTL